MFFLKYGKNIMNKKIKSNDSSHYIVNFLILLINHLL